MREMYVLFSISDAIGTAVLKTFGSRLEEVLWSHLVFPQKSSLWLGSIWNSSFQLHIRKTQQQEPDQEQTRKMEEVLDNTGPWHYPLLILNAVGGFTFPWRVMSMQFMAPKTQDYWCARPNDHISVEDWKALNEGVDIRCFVRDFEGSTNTSAKPCTTWEFDHSYYTRTLTEEVR